MCEDLGVEASEPTCGARITSTITRSPSDQQTRTKHTTARAIAVPSSRNSRSTSTKSPSENKIFMTTSSNKIKTSNSLSSFSTKKTRPTLITMNTDPTDACPSSTQTPDNSVQPTVVPISNGFVYYACYSDNVDKKTLPGAHFHDPANMTVDACTSFCSTSGFPKYAGIENGQE